MNAAGMIWMIIGGLEVLHMVAWYALVGGNRIDGIPVGCLPSGPAASWCAGLGGLLYLVAGYRTLTGRASDPQGYGIVSILLGLLQIFASLMYGLAGTDAQNGKVPGALFALSAVLGVFGTALVVAGVFALVSRSAYREWFRARWIARIRDRYKDED
jgi:hypothetical protein